MTKLAIDTNAKGIQCLRPVSTQTVTTATGAAANSTASTSGVRVVRLHSSTDCFYSVVGTATTGDTPLPAGIIEFIHVYDGDVVSFIASTTAGSAYVTEMI